MRSSASYLRSGTFLHTIFGRSIFHDRVSGTSICKILLLIAKLENDDFASCKQHAGTELKNDAEMDD